MRTPALWRAFDCPVCGCRQEATEVFVRKTYPILRCSGCGVGTTQLPATFSPAGIYTSAYFQGGQADGYADYAGAERILRGEFQRVVRDLRSAGWHSGRLLELGCAYGFFLEEAKPYFEVSGVEICENAVHFCQARGLDVKHGALDEECIRQPALDVAVMLDVIEHLAEPDRVLRLLHRGMRPGAALLISTGDWEAWLSRAMGRHWRLMTPPQHLFFFSPRTLSLLLSRTGFEVVAWRRPWKKIPLDLAVFQLGRMLGMANPPNWKQVRVSIPVNLFDAFRMLAVRR